MVAKDYETAYENSKYYKFYLDKRAKTSAIKISGEVLRDEAGGKLVTMYKNDFNKLFYITKLISYDSDLFKTGKNATPNEVFYQECSNYLKGKLHVNMTEAATEFLKYAKMTMTELMPRVLFKDGVSHKLIMQKEGVWYHHTTQTALGKNEEESIEFLMNSLNSGIFEKLKNTLTVKWTQ